MCGGVLGMGWWGCEEGCGRLKMPSDGRGDADVGGRVVVCGGAWCVVQ